MSKIDYTNVHDQKCYLIDYLENFLKPGSPIDQIEEEVRKTLTDVAFHEAERLLKKSSKK